MMPKWYAKFIKRISKNSEEKHIKKIVVSFEYRCYPIWLYDGDELIDTVLPEELQGDSQIKACFDRLQENYESLFINSCFEFDYIGFKSEADKNKFIKDVDDAVSLLKAKLGDSYVILQKKLNI